MWIEPPLFYPVPQAPDTFSTPAAFRVAFLTASTWAQATATNTELAHALLKWTLDTTVADAIAEMLQRRELDRRGLLRKMAREARDAERASEL